VSAHAEGELLAERVETLAAWIHQLEAQVRATSVSGDSKTLKELAKALEAWNKHDPKLEERITNRVDVLADRFATLAGTVNATATALAGKDGDIANLRRELEEGNARIEALVRELRQSGGGTDVAELRKAVAALAQDRSKAGDGRVDAISGEVDVIAQRVDTLSKTVSTTAAGLAGKEGELAALRARLEQDDGRAESVVRELRGSLEMLSRHVEELGARPRGSGNTELVTGALQELNGKVEQLAARLDTISTSIATTSEEVAQNESRLTSVHHDFEEASSRVDTMIGELRETVAALPAPSAGDSAVDDHLQALGRQVDGLTADVARLESATAARWDDATRATTELEQVVGEVSTRLAGLERERDAAAAVLDHSSAAWAEERTWVREQLEALAAAVEEDRDGEPLEPKLEELAIRLQAIEAGQESVGEEIARVSSAWDAERAKLKDELDAFATTLISQPPTAPTSERTDPNERFLAELTSRLDAMEREGTVVAAEIARAETFWAAEIGSLETRLSEVAGAAADAVPMRDTEADDRIAELARRLEAVELDREQMTGGSAEEAEELRDLRILINGVRMRLASSEKELAALGASGDVSARLDDLGLRLASLERTGASVPVATPVPGDGRFRVELRGLELRMEQLEVAARENRDAVLMQFERLASRLQWRLQQLELESADAAYGPTAVARPLGQVVPIRGEG
jgi:chromosome segregation ATPase